MKFDNCADGKPVICNLEDFDKQSGSIVERLFFNHRMIVLVVCLLVTLVLGFYATKLKLNADF